MSFLLLPEIEKEISRIESAEVFPGWEFIDLGGNGIVAQTPEFSAFANVDPLEIRRPRYTKDVFQVVIQKFTCPASGVEWFRPSNYGGINENDLNHDYWVNHCNRQASRINNVRELCDRIFDRSQWCGERDSDVSHAQLVAKYESSQRLYEIACGEQPSNGVRRWDGAASGGSNAGLSIRIRKGLKINFSLDYLIGKYPSIDGARCHE